MVDMFAIEGSREKFREETQNLAAAEQLEDAEMTLRQLLSEEPLAILYCVDGSYVKATPSILKTSNGQEENASSMTMREKLQNSYKEHLKTNKPEDMKLSHFGAAQVTSRVGACVGSLVTSHYTCFM